MKYSWRTNSGRDSYNSNFTLQEVDQMLSRPQNKKTIQDSLKFLIELKEFQKARQLIDLMLRKNPKDYFLLDAKGQILMDEGECTKSINYFTQAISVREVESPTIRGHRAEAFAIIKQYDSAISDYKECSKLNRSYYLPLAKTYETIKLNDSAIKYYHLFLKFYPDSLSISKKIDQLTTRNN